MRIFGVEIPLEISLVKIDLGKYFESKHKKELEERKFEREALIATSLRLQDKKARLLEEMGERSETPDGKTVFKKQAQKKRSEKLGHIQNLKTAKELA
jgi:hypothetical protein